MPLKPDERRSRELGESILATLRDLASSFRSLADEKERGISKAQVPAAEDHIPESSNVLRDITNSIDAFVGEQKSESKKTESFQHRSLVVQWLLFVATAAAFAAAAYYAHIARLQKDTMDNTLTEIRKQTGYARDSVKAAQDALKLASDNFRQDQRPYIWLMNSIGNPEFITSQANPGMGQVVWTWHVANYGKRPAQQIRFHSMIRLGDGPFRTSPGDPVGGSLGAPLPPNKDDFATVISEPITQQEWLRLSARTNTGNTIRVRVRYEYTDGVSGQTYESGMCFYRLNGGAIAYCREDNYIK